MSHYGNTIAALRKLGLSLEQANECWTVGDRERAEIQIQGTQELVRCYSSHRTEDDPEEYYIPVIAMQVDGNKSIVAFDRYHYEG